VKAATIVLLVFFAGVCGFLAYKYSQNAGQMQQSLDQERYTRMTTEENLGKASTKIRELEDQLSKLEKKMSSMQIVLDNTNAMNEDLKSRLDKVAVIKADMEKKIQDLQEMSNIQAPMPTSADAAVVVPVQ
jgi:chromosome segregation ATPase